VEKKMSKIEELLENEKVEWKAIGDIPQIDVISVSKKLKKQEYLNIGKYPIIDQGQEFVIGYTNDNDIILKDYPYVVFGDHTESIKYVDFSFAQGADGIKILKTDETYITAKYLYHVISNYYKPLGKYMRHFAFLKNTIIPIPSPETQKKIVEILDNFTDCVTELQAELQAELQNRIKQYEYYRNMLLSEEYLNKLSDKLGILPMEAENQIRCTTLGEIGKICMCKRILKEQTLPKGDVPFYKIGTFGKKSDAFISREVFDEYKEKYSYPKKGEVLVSCSGTIGRTVIFDGKDAYFQDSNIIWLSHDESIVLNKYLFYFYQNVRWNATSGGTISRLYTYNLVNLNIKLPSLPLQNKIVEILDRFQIMLSDTKGLLPKEIEQRQKQYEYYREKLLTFDVESDSKQASKQAR